MPTNVLDQIVADKRQEIEQAKTLRPLTELEAQVADAPQVRDFVAAMRDSKGIGLIAEVKKASPSAGIIRADFDPVEIARTYQDNGAACLSVLTDEPYFQGHLDYLKAVRAAIEIPVMRKEFIIDPYQVVEARAAGADCILLIAECLNDCQLRELYFQASDLGMECLIEIYDPENLERVLKLEPALLGINNRDLKTFVTELSHTTDLAKNVPAETLLVSESGIRTHDDVLHLQQFGVKGILVGESLMRQDDIGLAVRQLLGTA
ncbi:MAG: indole-3-glycerol phosphate synthase TrpC [Planctomycetaceae bacterium]|jgi:indole-3-glycerol phosphate synthase|nr:indole-3-glycerol phosphate synthase TrpC [Planctomycetaceae bacterium]MDG2391069.1 indole-3-glycerol phosphate synthase TrpC [Planctomycetaceae bacterium]